MDSDLVTQLRDELVKANLGQASPGAGAGPWASGIDIRAKRGNETRSGSFSSQDMEKLSRLESLLSILNDAVFVVGQHPFQSIRLELDAKGTGSGFTLRVKNVGTETVAIPDLQTLSGESNDLRRHGVGVRVATLPPARAGYTDPPLLWSRVDPASTTQSGGKTSVLAPGGEQILQTGNWSDKSGAGRIFAQGFFAFYAGPPVADGHLMMRGYALSSAVDIAKRHGP